ncbi:hypothetical protein FCOIX_3776 [Fusarium coicis]|nr:hypothetical protein FCOIX_3776 [Fusarium coicis]
MRTFTLLTSLAVGVSAGTVSAPIVKQRFHHESSLHSRDALSLTALNNITGCSSDTWLNSDETDLCNSRTKQEATGPCMTTFKPDDSRTYKLVDPDGFDITYLDTRSISGDYFNDTVTIDGKSIKQQRLGLATKSGLIDRAAFSLWLNDLSAEQGTILFGGLDTEKFVGKLATLPLLPDPSTLNLTHFTVAFEGFEVKTPKGQEIKIDSLKKDTTAILDSGATVCLLPEAQVGPIYKAFNVLSVEDVAIPFVDCAYRKDKGKGVSFDFKFDGKTISVPMSEMVINASSNKQEIFDGPQVSSYFDDWDSVWMFGISPVSQYGLTGGVTLLGDTFLRSAYVVYDLANEQLGVAEANHNTDKSNIVELKEKDTKFPDVTGVEGTSSSEEDDNAAVHLSPVSMVTLIVAAGITLTLVNMGID